MKPKSKIKNTTRIVVTDPAAAAVVERFQTNGESRPGCASRLICGYAELKSAQMDRTPTDAPA